MEVPALGDSLSSVFVISLQFTHQQKHVDILKTKGDIAPAVALALLLLFSDLSNEHRWLFHIETNRVCLLCPENVFAAHVENSCACTKCMSNFTRFE